MTPNINVDLSKRNFLKVSGMAGVGTLALGTTACEKKDVDFYIATVTGSMTQLKQFLPNQAVLLDRAISIAKEVNRAYQDGKFDTALGLARNLTTTINDIITAAGVNLSNTVKVIISIANVALAAVAVLIEGSIPASQANRALSPDAEKVREMASPKRVNAIFEASRP